MKHDLERLLGSDGFDIGCDACFDELDRFVEIEVTGGDAERVVPGMRRHLDACSACREEYESLLELAAER